MRLYFPRWPTSPENSSASEGYSDIHDLGWVVGCAAGCLEHHGENDLVHITWESTLLLGPKAQVVIPTEAVEKRPCRQQARPKQAPVLSKADLHPEKAWGFNTQLPFLADNVRTSSVPARRHATSVTRNSRKNRKSTKARVNAKPMYMRVRHE